MINQCCYFPHSKKIFEITLLNNVSSVGVLHIPNSQDKHFPLVIVLHGLASNKVGTKRSHLYLANHLIQAGIAVLRMDLPGHGDAEGFIHEFSLNDYIQASQRIIEFGLSLPIANDSVALFGSSLGGSLALLNLPHFPIVQHLAIWAPTIQGSLWLEDVAQLTSLPQNVSSENFFYQGIPLGKEFCSQFIELDTLKVLSKIPKQTSILYLQGENDPVVSTRHQALFAKTFSGEASYRIYPKMTHHLCVDSEAFRDLVNWIKNQLLGTSWSYSL
ncbi:alpha/beta hydrolase [Chlamydia sp.]|uniref:alpha/beta hydrolase n=1 Tax=Chlamydia sp. TaxID=35827 RepID=UPI0025BFBDC1|nr:alpha/beta hydrolase [Chlamydia sp.]MBQ8498357.1 alpha/beta hydrolase [Chlamydia sp.]